jgi:glycosyltransferase involved in cell wall biosynthesis
MDLRTLLLLTYHFPPSAASGSFRLLGFARHLPKRGWRIAVVAPERTPWESLDPELVKQLSPETIVERVPYPSSRGLGRIYLRLMPFMCWLPGAWRGSIRVMKQHRPEAILTSGPYHHVHILGRWLKRRYHVPLIADFRDPWVAQNAGAEHDRSLYARWERRQERAVMQEADAIVVNTPNAAADLARVYPFARDRIVAITNGFDPERFDDLPRPRPGDDGADVLTILHPGQLYAGRDPRPLFDALRAVLARRAPEARPIRLVFLGNLDVDRPGFNLRAEIGRRGLDGVVQLRGPVPYTQSLVEMTRADLLLLLDAAGRRIGVPAKLYEFVGAGRPILALGEADGDTAWVLRECAVPHRVAPPGDAAAIERALEELIAEIDSGAAAGPTGPGRLRFTRENLARQLAEILDRCALPAAEPDPGRRIGSPLAVAAADSRPLP